jgi:hypothetical protein
VAVEEAAVLAEAAAEAAAMLAGTGAVAQQGSAGAAKP